MNVIANGEGREIPDGTSVLALLESLALSAEITIVERNGDILGRADYARTILADGDRLELVRIVGGG
jgi:thiamine biosynthesis protein ThiS